MIPHDLIAAVSALRFENPDDERLAADALSKPDDASPATIAWLAALVARNGARFDKDNKEHCTPHKWPSFQV